MTALDKKENIWFVTESVTFDIFDSAQRAVSTVPSVKPNTLCIPVSDAIKRRISDAKQGSLKVRCLGHTERLEVNSVFFFLSAQPKV